MFQSEEKTFRERMYKRVNEEDEKFEKTASKSGISPERRREISEMAASVKIIRNPKKDGRIS